MKKAFSLLLAALLLLTLALPTTAGALEEAKEKIDRIRNGWTEPPTATPAPTETPVPDDYISPWANTRAWAKDCGFTCDIWGQTSAYLTPIANFFRLLPDRGIYVTAKEIMIDTDKRDWISIELGSSFYVMVSITEEAATFALEVPYHYLPADDLARLAISLFMDVDEEEAAKLFDALKYNVSDEYAALPPQNGRVLTLYEPRRSNGQLTGFYTVYIDIPTPDWNAIPPIDLP